MKDKTELDFVLKQIKSVKENGLICAIIPLSKLNIKTTQRQLIASKCKIKTIIICSEKAFYPAAMIKCCIIMLEKNKEGHKSTDLVKIIDYSDDGFEVKRNFGRVQTAEFSTIFEGIKKKINESEGQTINISSADWVKITSTQLENRMVNLKDLKMNISEIEYQQNILKIHTMPYDEISAQNYKIFKITDLFKILKKPDEKSSAEYAFLIAAKKVNNGVKSIIKANSGTFTGNKIVLVVGGDGGAGMAFYQPLDFNITSSTIVLKPTKIKLDKYVGAYCATELSKYKAIYSRAYGWTMDRIKETTMLLPILKDESIDYGFIQRMSEI